MDRARLRRVAKRLLQVALGAAAVYLVAMNVLLRTNLLRHLANGDPGSLRIEYASAYSIFPGLIHVDHLTIRARDSSVEWALAIDECDFRVSFTSLSRQRFLASRVRARGVAFRVRLRLATEDATPEHLAAIPRIDGFHDPPYEDVGPPSPPITDAQYNLWSVELEDVDAIHVREVWVDAIRTVGDMHVRGRWLFRPLRTLEVGPATVDVSAVDVSYGVETFAGAMTGSLAVTVHPFDMRVPNGLEVLTYVSASTGVRGTLPALGNAWARAHGVDLAGGPGAFDAALLLDHGKLLPGARARADVPRARVDVSGRSVQADIHAELDVRNGPDGLPSAHVELRTTDVVATAPEIGEARAGHISMVADSPDVDLSRAPAHAKIALDADDAETASLAKLGNLLPAASGVRVGSGSARIDGHIEGSFPEKHARGSIRFALQRVAVARDHDHIEADASGTVVIADAALDEMELDLTGSDVVVRDAVVDVRGVTVRAASVAGKATHARVGVGSPIDVAADIDSSTVEVPELRDVNHLLPAGSPFSVTAGGARASGALHVGLPARSLTGWARVDTHGVRGRAGPASWGATLAARVVLGSGNLTTRSFDFSGSEASLSQVSVTLIHGVVATSPLVVWRLDASAPALTIDGGKLAGRLHVSLPAARIANLEGLPVALGAPPDVALHGGGVRARAQGNVDLEARTFDGSISLAVAGVSARIGTDSLTGNVTANILARPVRGQAGVTDVSGSSVVFDDVGHGGAVFPTEGWWGRVELADAQLRAGPTPNFRGRVDVRARDATPITALLVARGKVPVWAAPYLRMQGIRADAQVRANASSFELHACVARGESTSIRSWYEKRGKDKDGAVFVDLGIVKAGIGLGADSGYLLLFGARTWFDREAAEFETRSANGT